MKREYVSVYLRNSHNNPSCYYRVAQYIDELEQMGYHFKINEAITTKQYFYNLKEKKRIFDILFKSYLYLNLYFRRLKSIIYDVLFSPTHIIVQREVFPRYMPPLLGRLYSKLIKEHCVIWDFDDNIIWNGEVSSEERRLLERYSNNIIVTHEYLRDTINEASKDKVILLPTTDKKIEEDIYEKSMMERILEFDRVIKVIWIGTSSNLKNLDLVIDAIERVSYKLKNQYSKELEFTIVSNEKYLCRNANFKIVNVMWNRTIAKELCLGSHIGIMPLFDGEFARGKGGFKLIQYLSCGLPVIASDVGFNNQIVDTNCGFIFSNACIDEWENAVLAMATNKELWIEKAKAALRKYETSFSYDRNIELWKIMLREM